MKYYIYTLTNPLNGEIFYVGKTVNMETRYRQHLNFNFADKNLKNEVIKFVLEQSAVPIIEELDCVDCVYREDEDYVNELEIYWIHQLRAWGMPLKNKHSIYKPTKYSRIYSHILKESTFEFIIKAIIKRWDKFYALKNRIEADINLTLDEKEFLYQDITIGWNETLDFWNKHLDIGFEPETDLKWLNKRPYSRFPKYITDSPDPILQD